MGYSIDVSRHIWLITFTGTLSNDDVDRLGAETAKIDATGTFVPNRMIDLRQLEAVHIGFLDMSRLVDRRKAVTLPNNVKSGILTDSPIQFGFARMFQTLLDHPQIEVRIFSDEKEVLAWLAT